MAEKKTGLVFEEGTYRNESSWSYPQWSIVEDNQIIIYDMVMNNEDKESSLKNLIARAKRAIEQGKTLERLLPLVESQAKEMLNKEKQEKIDLLQKEIDKLRKEIELYGAN